MFKYIQLPSAIPATVPRIVGTDKPNKPTTNKIDQKMKRSGSKINPKSITNQ